MLDDRAPHAYLGAGYPRAHDILASLDELGHKVSFVPCVLTETRKEAARSLPARCKYQPMKSHAEIVRYVENHPHRFDVLWVSRPHNMALLKRYLPVNHPVWRAYSRVIYDAEAIFALRNDMMKAFYPDAPRGMPFSSEMDLTETADVVAVVNPSDSCHFAKRGLRTVALRARYETRKSGAGFEKRSGFLFVGSLRDHPSPNSDALIWFCKKVAPLLREELGDEFRLDVAGMIRSTAVEQLKAPGINLLGMVPDLARYYDGSRVFVAPHRFAAGLPCKILEAASTGLPVVASDLLAEQLDWQNGRELMTAITGDDRSFAAACLELYRNKTKWDSLRETALGQVAGEFSKTIFQDALSSLLITPQSRRF